MARVRLGVDVEPEIKHRLAVLAALRGVTMSDFVVDALRVVLAEEGIEGPVQESFGLTGRTGRTAYRDRGRRGTCVRFSRGILGPAKRDRGNTYRSFCSQLMETLPEGCRTRGAQTLWDLIVGFFRCMAGFITSCNRGGNPQF